jgi:hypothetical protein
MAEMELEGYLQPVVNAVRTTFLMWRAASRHMVKQGSGAILAFGGEGHLYGATTLAGFRSRSMRSSRSPPKMADSRCTGSTRSFGCSPFQQPQPEIARRVGVGEADEEHHRGLDVPRRGQRTGVDGVPP